MSGKRGDERRPEVRVTTEHLVTTGQAAELLGVPAARIAEWKSRGRITATGLLRGAGRTGTVPLYDLAELRPIAEQYHQRATRRRQTDP